MENNRQEFLKECISDAVFQLLREKPLNKITADDISKRAGVGRATYFRYFKSKQDAIIYKRRLLWQRYCDKHGIIYRDKFYIGNSKAFFSFIYENKDSARLLYHTGNEYLLFDYYRSVAESPTLSSEQRYREKFLIFGLIGLLDEWSMTDFKDTPEKMSERLDSIIASINYAPKT